MKPLPGISVSFPHSAPAGGEMGMRAMQALAYRKRGEQYLLIKSPPASGKSRALMYVALDKLARQGVRQAIVVVPERSIGASFRSEALSDSGFWADWVVQPRWNLCDSPGTDGGKVKSVAAFLAGDDQVLVCTHATFRFAVEQLGIEAFDERLIAVDEFHHVSVNPDNRLGAQLSAFLARDKVHVVAMTGSYFRGDAVAVLAPADEARFETVTFTYYQQLNGYQYLKALDLGYAFYSGSYLDQIGEVLKPGEKTIIHIPNVNARESTKDKIQEANAILGVLGAWEGVDPQTGFQLVRAPDGRVLRVADLVDDEGRRDVVMAALRDPAGRQNRDHVDVIIALGMAKEGFDWVWCEHALTVGYRASLTEVVQIIGRATRDAPGKARARFTNLIAEPEAAQGVVSEAVNDTLKAIAASLLMEQVLAPRYEFTPKLAGPVAGVEYGGDGYDATRCNVGFSEERGAFQIEVRGLAMPQSDEAKRICREDLNELVASFVQDTPSVARGLFDAELVPQELTQVAMERIVRTRYPQLEEQDQEAIRQHAVAAMNLTQKGSAAALEMTQDGTARGNTALIDGVRKFVTDVRDLDIELIDSINPFGPAYAIVAKAMDAERLAEVAAAIAGRRSSISPDEAKRLAVRAVAFKRERGRGPNVMAGDAWEKRMAEGAAAFMRYKKEGRYEKEGRDNGDGASRFAGDVSDLKMVGKSIGSRSLLTAQEERDNEAHAAALAVAAAVANGMDET